MTFTKIYKINELYEHFEYYSSFLVRLKILIKFLDLREWAGSSRTPEEEKEFTSLTSLDRIYPR